MEMFSARRIVHMIWAANRDPKKGYQQPHELWELPDIDADMLPSKEEGMDHATHVLNMWKKNKGLA